MPNDPNTTTASNVPPGLAKLRAKRITPTKQRKLLENTIERLVELLDQIDPDPDLEDNGDREPSLGWPIPQAKLGQGLNTDADCRGDFGDDREHDTADNEPELGWTEMEARFGKYSDGGDDDQVDNEASLGWQNESSQGRLHASRDDCEEQCEDEGAEHDGREIDGDSWPNPMGENRIGEVR
jgi:hypothetical protein